jgi:hypothetical protein
MTTPNPRTHTAAQLGAQIVAIHAGARAHIWCCVRVLGPERTHAFVKEALDVDAHGGMLIPDGSRRRTLGGIFFSLVRTQVSDDEAMRINRAWRWHQWKQRQPKQPNAPTASAPPTFPPFVWEEAASIIAELTAHAGDATTVNVTVIGRPTHVVERQGVLILTFRSTNAPTLPATPTTSMIVMQQKQWNKVRDALHQPDDALIVEGYPVHEPRFTGITVYVTNVTTKAVHAAKRKEQTASVSEG